MYELGHLYFWGSSCAQNLPKANGYFKKAAEKGHPNAQYILAYLYQYALGVKQNDEIALEWFIKAAEQGIMLAQRHAGDLYLNKKEYGRAFKMFQMAADQHDAHSCRRLGDLYELGLGCCRNTGAARKYYELAASQGDALAEKSLKLNSIPLLSYDI
jgi:TPR repeat protein